MKLDRLSRALSNFILFFLLCVFAPWREVGMSARAGICGHTRSARNFKKYGNSLAIGKPMGDHRLNRWEGEVNGNSVRSGDLSERKPTSWSDSGPSTTAAFFAFAHRALRRIRSPRDISRRGARNERKI
jgi:hypothetical protein